MWLNKVLAKTKIFIILIALFQPLLGAHFSNLVISFKLFCRSAIIDQTQADTDYFKEILALVDTVCPDQLLAREPGIEIAEISPRGVQPVSMLGVCPRYKYTVTDGQSLRASLQRIPPIERGLLLLCLNSEFVYSDLSGDEFLEVHFNGLSNEFAKADAIKQLMNSLGLQYQIGPFLADQTRERKREILMLKQRLIFQAVQRVARASIQQ